MSLILEDVDLQVGREMHIDRASLELAPGSFNVLLGRTLAGKTTLMRLMAGLEMPTRGRIVMNGHDVTRLSVRQRNVSMVYQQFINYPGMTLYENIASPLRLAKVDQEEIDRRVHETAEMLHIEHLLERYPLELSGGQQQRTAMGRALVKDADVILFDEPLVNLDYKLREELREELRTLFAERHCIAVYATTEPSEALSLGGHTAVLHQGQVLQYGPTEEVYRWPNSTRAAEMFSEPPMNFLDGEITDSSVIIGERYRLPDNAGFLHLPPGSYRFGIRASHISLIPNDDRDIAMDVRVDLAEISGSETFLHVHDQQSDMTVHLAGIHEFEVDDEVTLYFPVHKVYAFDAQGSVAHVPAYLGES
ncbi:ABC transporter ATP-binding protein [Aidingimonas halophila]|uniref:Carbohydrate ABC transporter ATP-binding protein, CUT1 family n=1 Tax=Aidingimonas halophila TaxID=574349 RepID=A0A1H3B1N9_9GAMM|nr:ABC transporter ATP-binding protein [Aidingimonas halophila]SDX35852.1 carbohydrate ABC transporter ATP-binding protein, CUT1 family [Aidingimonas halophila]